MPRLDGKANVQHYRKTLEELRKRAALCPECEDWISLYFDLLSAQALVAAQIRRTDIHITPVTRRLAAGLPLLDPKDFNADRTLFTHLGHEICAIVERHYPELAAPLHDVGSRFDEGRAPSAVWASLLRRSQDRQGEEDELRHSLLAFIYNQALHPFLRAYAEAFSPYVEQDIWYRPICPICGGEPDFSALEKMSGARRLLCSHCDTEWTFWRTVCPFCGSDDSATQKYSMYEDAVYRLYTCQTCKRYLKTIDLREIAEERLLPVERLLTAPMDVAARLVENA